MKIKIKENETEYLIDIPEDEIPVFVSSIQEKNPPVILEQTTVSPLTDWKRVAEICRSGKAEKYFSIGQYLSFYSPVWGFLEWEIARMENDGFWLVARRPVCSMQFDAPEEKNHGLSKNIKFRGEYGSNNPLHCAPHKFLNSDAPNGGWWKSSTCFDAPPEEHNDLPGFLNSVPKDFLDCVKETDVVMDIPECDGGGEKKQKLKFFLPSKTEIFGEHPFFKIKTTKKNGCIWWLRSPFVGISYSVFYVSSSGSLYFSFALSAIGCVPACRIG